MHIDVFARRGLVETKCPQSRPEVCLDVGRVVRVVMIFVGLVVTLMIAALLLLAGAGFLFFPVPAVLLGVTSTFLLTSLPSFGLASRFFSSVLTLPRLVARFLITVALFSIGYHADTLRLDFALAFRMVESFVLLVAHADRTCDPTEGGAGDPAVRGRCARSFTCARRSPDECGP
jgi:hypothetical protein